MRARTSAETALEEHIVRNLPMVRSVLVSRHGALEYERYFSDADSTERVNIWSCTKSVISMLLGVLALEGALPDLDERVGDLLPSLAEVAHPSFSVVTLRDCLRMTLGYRTDIGYHDVRATIARPLDTPSGRGFFYNDVGPQIVSMLIVDRTGLSTSTFANMRLFAPLGIQDPPWRLAADSYHTGGWGLMLTPREMLTFGEFALRAGEWNGAQLVDQAFFAESVSVRSDGGFPGNDRYGFLWWVSDRNGVVTYYALGFGAQLICVTPALGLVTVITCTDELAANVAPIQSLYFDHVMQS